MRTQREEAPAAGNKPQLLLEGSEAVWWWGDWCRWVESQADQVKQDLYEIFNNINLFSSLGTFEQQKQLFVSFFPVKRKVQVLVLLFLVT